MRSIRFSDQVHHSNEISDSYYGEDPSYREDPSVRTPNDIDDYVNDDYFSKQNGESDLLLNNYHGRNFSRPHRKVRRERSFDSLPLTEYGDRDNGYGHSSVHSLPRRLKTSKTTYFSPGVRAAQQVSEAAAYHLNRPSSALPNRPPEPRPDYLDGPSLDETCFNFQNTDTDPYYAMRDMMPPPGDAGRKIDRSASYLTVPSHNASILKTESSLDDEYLDEFNYEDNKSSSHLYSTEGRIGVQANGSNYSSSSPRSAMSAESMGGGGGNYGRTGILKKESILKNSYNGSSEAERRPSGIVYKNYVMLANTGC